MTGSLQTKNEKFYIVLNDMVNGKRKQRWIATGLTVKGNKRKAEQLLREKLAEEMQKAPLPVSDMRRSDCIRHWLTWVQRAWMKSPIWAICIQRRSTYFPISIPAV